ncbi:MAG: transcription termination/antitermination protein NusA [Candidatus Latescibacteria bacterium]|nr:transcription termination/antitermination protein NusA [Candidatus Latescibacterota bacterium]
MNKEIIEVLTQISREKDVSRDLVVESLKAGLVSAVKKRLGTTENVHAEIDPNTGEIKIYVEKLVVPEIQNPSLEITPEEGQKIDPDARVGDKIQQELPLNQFGRNAIQTAKQILMQRIREAERERIYQNYQKRIGEILVGTVQQISQGDLILNLGKIEGILPVKEQIKKERYRQGDTIRAYAFDVVKTPKGPQVMLSRTHPRFLERLFQMEVPEVYEGIVQIKAVARDPGDRAKIAVASNDERVDPVGACVGVRGLRVQAVVRELNNEQVDIIPWSSDPATFLARALSPATITKTEVKDEEHRIIAIVPDDQLSLAIGKSGQNVRLASMLTGWKIDILSESRYKELTEKIPITKLKGVGNKLATELNKVGVDSVQRLIKLTAKQLTQVPGIGNKRAESLLSEAAEIIKDGQKATG